MERRVRSTRSALATALLTAGLTCSLPSGAGIMHPDFEPLLYGDFAEGRGVFAPDKLGPIKIYDNNGNLRGTIAQALPLSAVADGHYATMVDPRWSISATHVTDAQQLQFGNQTSFIYNDNTLFKNSATVTPFSGKYADLQRVLSELALYKATYLKYLGNNYTAAHFDVMRNTNQREQDFKVTRYSKLNTEAVPVPLLTRGISPGEDLAHVGAGNTRVIDGNRSVELIRGTPVGGFVHIDNTQPFNATDVDINGSSYKAKPYYGLSYLTRFTVTTSKQMALPHATLTNDSGSGLFAWNNEKQHWEIAAVTSQGSQSTNFGKETIFVGNPSWANARINYYDDPAIQVSTGQSVVFHGQNNQNGNGYLHLVNSKFQDQADNQLASDIARAQKDNELHAQHQAYRIEQEIRGTTQASGFKPGVDPYADKTPDNSTYAAASGITRVAYHGLAWGYDYKLYGDTATGEKYRFYQNQELQRHARNITLVGTGSSEVHKISFAEDIKVGQSTINLGAASINLRNGNFYLGDLQNTGLKSFIHAGYDIAANASLTLALNGQSDDAIHKVGAGKLTIAGTGNQESPLNIGDGTVELMRSKGYAAPYIKIASGRATVQLGADQQLNRHLDDIENNVGFGFGRDGGTLDFAGFDTKQTWNDIYHLDAGARIVNSYPKQDVTFTFQPDGVRTYKGEFAGNLNLIYDPSKITTEPKTWYLTGNTYITGDFLVKMGGTVRVGDYQEPRAWGTSFNDRYFSNSLIAKEIAVQDKSSLIVGRNALVQGRIVLAKGATLDIHNLGEFASPHNPYQVPAQPTIERTIVAGELSTSEGSNVVITTNQNHRIDLYSDWSGKGRVSFQGNGYINLLGDNDKFKGTVEFCGQKTAFAVNPNILAQITNPEPQLSTQGCTTRNNMPDYAPGFATNDYIYANVISQSNADKELPSLLGLDAQGNLTSAQFTPPTWDSKKLQTLAANADKQAFHAQVAQIQRAGLTDAELAEQPLRPKPPGNSIANPTVVTFFDGDSAWNNASKVTTNGQVILHAHLHENAQWNFRNYTGDGIFVKSGTGNLYLADHNLNGLVYLVSGKLGGNTFAKDVLVKPAGQLVVNANQHTGTSIYGNLDNAGSVLLTSNKEQLLATTNLGNDTTHSTNVASRFVNRKLHTIPVHTQLYIGGDYVGQNGEIEFATNDAPEQIYILGNVSGTTTLKVGAFKASTAQNLSTIDLIEAKGTIAANSFILPQGYVTGGIYDYRLQQLDNKVVLSNARLHVDEPTPAPQPNPTVPPKPTPNSGNTGNQTNNQAGQSQPQPGKQFESDGRGSITQLVPLPQPKPQPQPQPQQGDKPPAPQAVTQPKPKNLVLNPQDTTGTRIVQKVTWDEQLVRGKPVLTKAQAAQQAEYNKRNHDLSDATTESMTDNSSNLISSSNADSSTPTGAEANSAHTTSADNNTLTLATNAQQPQVGGRLINASVGSLLANAQFLQQASQVPLNRLLASDGLSLTRSQAQSSLDFSGVDYGSSYATESWTLGYAAQYQSNVRYGAWLQSTQGNSKVDNGVSDSKGQLSTRGWGAWASWQALPNWQVATGYQQLSYQAQTAGAHQQQATGTTRHYSVQVSYHGWNAQWRDINFSARPYLSYGYSQLPRLEFISNLGENLGVVRAQPHSLQLGIQATASYRNLSAQLGLTQHLLNQEVVFEDAFGREQLAVHPQQWQVNTALRYQFNQNWSAHAYLQAQARSSNYGVGLTWKW